jgi:hypothetical protein
MALKVSELPNRFESDNLTSLSESVSVLLGDWRSSLLNVEILHFHPSELSFLIDLSLV